MLRPQGSAFSFTSQQLERQPFGGEQQSGGEDEPPLHAIDERLSTDDPPPADRDEDEGGE
jgi:hypothetical protein